MPVCYKLINAVLYANDADADADEDDVDNDDDCDDGYPSSDPVP